MRGSARLDDLSAPAAGTACAVSAHDLRLAPAPRLAHSVEGGAQVVVLGSTFAPLAVFAIYVVVRFGWPYRAAKHDAIEAIVDRCVFCKVLL